MLYSDAEGKISQNPPLVSLLDHGFLFGDSLYEVVRLYDKKIFAWTEHMERLCRSGNRVGLDVQSLLPELVRRAEHLLSVLKEPNAALRIMVSRGVGDLHIDPRSCKNPAVYMVAWKLAPERLPLEISLIVATIRRNSRLALDPAIKSGNYLNSVLAFKEAAELGFDDAVMLNVEGFLTELTTSNIGWISLGRIYTPRIDTGILHGITRKFFIQKIEVHEGDYTPDVLKKADEVFALSTFKEVLPVTSIRFENGYVQHYPKGERTTSLQNQFKKLLNLELEKQKVLF